MSPKRDLAELESDPASEPASKRPRQSSKPNGKSREHQNGHVDPTWGQKYVFSSLAGGTTVPADPDVDFEDDADAMEYLRSVRQEASAIPHLLVAPKLGPQLPQSFLNGAQHDDDGGEDDGEVVDRSIYKNGGGDFRGYYHDGAYTAMPDEWDQDEAGHELNEAGEYGEDGGYDASQVDDEDARAPADAIDEAYYLSVKQQFLALRTHLHTSPNPAAVAALPRNHSPLVFPFGRGSRTFPIWDHRLRNFDPLPVQVAAMDRDGVLRVLQVLLGGKFLRRGIELRERTSRWLWALLARLPDAGELDGGDVAWVRDLGKRAVLLMRSLAEMAALREELDGAGRDLGVNEGVDDSSDDDEVANEMAVEEAGELRAGGSASGSPAAGGSPEVKGEVDDGEVEPGAADQTVKVEDHGDDIEEGEVEDEAGSAPMSEASEDSLQGVKARLLARLDEDAGADPESDEEPPETVRARTNMRATLNMILTIAGELYGQRDLLEFRDPFPAL